MDFILYCMPFLIIFISFYSIHYSNYIDINNSITLIEGSGFEIVFGKNVFKNTLGYGATAKEKAEDINNMFANPEIKGVLCATGGANSNSTFEYLDYELIKANPKIICGFSDDKFYCIKEGIAEGKLIGGNLSLTANLCSGKYSIDFTDKILFIEELAYETDAEMASNYLYKMKQNGVFDKIKGIWVGNYEGEVPLEKILLDTLEDEYDFPIIKSNNFGHTDRKMVIPIGTKAKIDTSKEIKIELLENCVK